MDLMLQPLRKYADFNGRARRAEYWLFALFVALVQMATAILSWFVGGDMSGDAFATPASAVIARCTSATVQVTLRPTATMPHNA